MTITRRSFLAGILALGVAPAVVKASSIMRVRPIILPGDDEFRLFTGEIGRYESVRFTESAPDSFASEMFEFNRREVSADGKTHTLETWYEDGNGFLLPSGRLDLPRGEYRGTSKLWGDHG